MLQVSIHIMTVWVTGWSWYLTHSGVLRNRSSETMTMTNAPDHVRNNYTWTWLLPKNPSNIDLSQQSFTVRVRRCFQTQMMRCHDAFHMTYIVFIFIASMSIMWICISLLPLSISNKFMSSKSVTSHEFPISRLSYFLLDSKSLRTICRDEADTNFMSHCPKLQSLW